MTILGLSIMIIAVLLNIGMFMAAKKIMHCDHTKQKGGKCKL